MLLLPALLVQDRFCDIVSRAPNLHYFNVYIEPMAAVKDPDTSSIVQTWDLVPVLVPLVRVPVMLV